MCAKVTSSVLAIMGMQRNSCREHVIEVLENIAGVRSVDVNLIRAVATVIYDHPCDTAQLLESLQAAGYDAAVI